MMNEIEIKMFPASYGDSFLVTCKGEKRTHILIDMGFKSTYDKTIKKELKDISKEGGKLSLLVFTHVDEDHILGGIKFLQENGDVNSPKVIEVDEVWHNNYKHLQFEKKKLLKEKEELKESSEEILTKIINKGHGKEKGVKEVSNISFEQAWTLVGALCQNGYTDRWNKTFQNQAVSVVKNDNTLRTISINDEVKITILSPDEKKLNELDKAWESRLAELGFKDKVESTELMEDAFEIYMANFVENKKKSRKVRQVSGEEIDIDAIANQEFEPDCKPVNGSSIAFILELGEKKVLFLGDSHSETIEKHLKEILASSSQEKMHFDAVKISHHGSKHNTSKALLDLIDTDTYIISTNGKSFNHPDIETLYRIITSNKEKTKKIIFNYKPIRLFNKINNQELKNKYKFEIEYTNDLAEDIINEITKISIK
ncbi:MBL fold metallo-hydrolase [Bacillus cereus group sp. BfR-BA-01400]|uniref:MBL fold metallo-hydrolase n=1 Tax=Bacillus cereus group sp. BfR-BA-01400 TaxID=2920334 RepID=UPI001F5AFEB7